MNTLKDSNIIKVVCNNLVRKAIQIHRKLAEKVEYKKEKDNDSTKQVEINENVEVAETDNDEIFANSRDGAPPSQYAITTTTAATAEEGVEDNNMSAQDGKRNYEEDDTKEEEEEEEGREIRRSKTATTTTTKRT